MSDWGDWSFRVPLDGLLTPQEIDEMSIRYDDGRFIEGLHQKYKNTKLYIDRLQQAKKQEEEIRKNLNPPPRHGGPRGGSRRKRSRRHRRKSYRR